MRQHSGGFKILATLLAAAAMHGQAVQAEPAAGVYKIGFVTENTGPLAYAGQSYWNGAQLAVSEINEKKYLGAGATLALDGKESASDAARAIQAMRQFIGDRSVIATSCCILSPVANALKPVVVGAKVPMVIFGATGPGLPQAPWVYNMTILPGPQDVATGVDVSKKLNLKSAAYILTSDNDAFKGRMEDTRHALEAQGVKTTGVVNVLTRDTDFTAAATQAMAMNADMILVYATQGAATGAITALRDRGYKKTIVTTDVVSPASVFKKMGSALVGVPYPISFSDTLSTTPEAKAFANDYQKRFGATPDIYSAQGYQVAWFVAQGLKSLSGTPTREQLAGALSKIKTIEHTVYGSEEMVAGQATTRGTLIVNRTSEGSLVAWAPAK
jgi:branched-chain amino acid transport system substrate-binding protein